jgi:hypothetical protein
MASDSGDEIGGRQWAIINLTRLLEALPSFSGIGKFPEVEGAGRIIRGHHYKTRRCLMFCFLFQFRDLFLKDPDFIPQPLHLSGFETLISILL